MIKKTKIKEKIKEIHEDSHKIYGAPKITKILNQRGHNIALRTVSTYMQEEGIRAHYRKPYTATTINSNFSMKLKNILKRDFNPEKPNSIWCSDITSIWTERSFVYLISIIDLYSRRIIAWEVTDSLSVSGVISCVNKAKKKRNLDKPIIVHSDRGKQYTSQAYKEALGKGFIRSYSRKANPWDNACIESFHSLIKREWLNRYYFRNIADVRKAIFEYIKVFYNRKRIHGSIDYMTPLKYEQQYFAAN